MVTSHYVTNLKAALLNGHQVLHYWLSATEELGVLIWGRSYWRVTLFGDNKRNFGTHGFHRGVHFSRSRWGCCRGSVFYIIFTQQDNTLCGLNRYSTVDRTQGAIIFWLCSMPYDYILDATLFWWNLSKIKSGETQINNPKVENMFLPWGRQTPSD
jgi:hypothetical protein